MLKIVKNQTFIREKSYFYLQKYEFIRNVFMYEKEKPQIYEIDTCFINLRDTLHDMSGSALQCKRERHRH